MNEIEKGILAARSEKPQRDADGTMTGRYRFGAGFIGFGGHFPGYPILPAIVEIATAVSLVSELEGPKRLVAVEDGKFLKPVRPEQELLVTCRRRSVRGKELYDATLSAAGEVTATLLLDLAPAEEPE
jgi:3-hydroxyacyl-[acyl-carrier-protein] dehydratase